jgi:hypothetical protein
MLDVVNVLVLAIALSDGLAAGILILLQGFCETQLNKTGSNWHKCVAPGAAVHLPCAPPSTSLAHRLGPAGTSMASHGPSRLVLLVRRLDSTDDLLTGKSTVVRSGAD